MSEFQQKSTQMVESVDKTIGLTPSQERCAVMLSSGMTITETAKELGLDRGTLYQWLKKVTFQCYLNQLRKEVQQYLTGKLFELHSSAVEAIQRGLESDNEGVRLKTAMWVFEKLESMRIEEADARKVIERECTSSGDWSLETFNADKYSRRLEEEGLSR